MDHHTEACELIRDVLDDAAEYALTITERIAVADTLATLALVEALRSPAAPVPPGPCFEPNWGVAGLSPARCDLLAGHAGAHVWRTAGGGEGRWVTPTTEDKEAER